MHQKLYKPGPQKRSTRTVEIIELLLSLSSGCVESKPCSCKERVDDQEAFKLFRSLYGIPSTVYIEKTLLRPGKGPHGT